MHKVLGFGGFFFKAHNPQALARWYADHLGVGITPGEYGGESWMPQGGSCAFQPFAQDSDFLPTAFMLNFRVADLEAMAAQLVAMGVAVEVDPTEWPNGRFATLSDPEGNPIQLWQETA